MVTILYIYFFQILHRKRARASHFLSSPFFLLFCARTDNPLSSVVSHGDKDVQVETVVGLPEEEDEDEAEETRARQTPVQPRQLCAVKSEKEEKKAGDQIPQEGDDSAGDAFRNRVHGFYEELKEYWHTAVDKDAYQDAGCVEDGCRGGEVSDPAQTGESEPGR